jgi:hypothetical protein
VHPLAAAIAEARANGVQAVGLIGANTLRSSIKLGIPLHVVHGNNLGDQAAMHCSFNRSMQHTRICVDRRSVADETKTTDILHGKPEVSHVGSLAKG